MNIKKKLAYAITTGIIGILGYTPVALAMSPPKIDNTVQVAIKDDSAMRFRLFTNMTFDFDLNQIKYIGLNQSNDGDYSGYHMFTVGERDGKTLGLIVLENTGDNIDAIRVGISNSSLVDRLGGSGIFNATISDESINFVLAYCRAITNTTSAEVIQITDVTFDGEIDNSTEINFRKSLTDRLNALAGFQLDNFKDPVYIIGFEYNF